MHLSLFWKWWMNDLMLFACIYMWKADFSWGRQKQMGTASKPRRNKMGGVNGKSKDSLPLQASITKCQLRTMSPSVLARKYSWQVMPLACHATFMVARSLYKSKDYSTQKTYTAIIEILIGISLSECSYLLVGLPLPHSFIPKNVRYCHRTTSWRRKKTNTLIFLSLFYFRK